jgi:hypothetical protein
MDRSTSRFVIFTKPFVLPDLDLEQPPGRYRVDTVEELLQPLSFEVWRRVSTIMILPASTGGAPVDQVVEVDPTVLAAALALDGASEAVQGACSFRTEPDGGRIGGAYFPVKSCGKMF